MLKEKDKPPESKSYMWVQARSGDKPIVLYDHNPSRSAKVPMDLLNGFKGYLQIDGYAGYNSIGREEGITRVGCMSHCRRYFFRAWKHSKTKNIGSRGLAFIRKLYKIEESIKEYSEEEKKRIRLEKSKPILEEMKVERIGYLVIHLKERMRMPCGIVLLKQPKRMAMNHILNVLNKIPTANSLEDYMKLLPFNISDKK